MAKTKTEYDLLISCPGDLDSVVKLVNAVVKNSTIIILMCFR